MIGSIQASIIVAIMGAIRINKEMAAATLNMVRFDRRQRVPLQKQLYRQIRQLIISGQLQTGIRLPSTRDLVSQLGVSRNTIVYALDQLIAEGYLISRVGSGIYVADLPMRDARTSSLGLSKATAGKLPIIPQRSPQLSTINIAPLYASTKVRPFRPCQPAVDHFPLRNWNRARASALRLQPRELFAEGDPAGLLRLRRALATYLQDARGVRCTPEQIIITAGTQQALSLIGSHLLDPGDPVWIEDPGYLGARAAFLAAAATLVPIPIDKDGLTIPERTKPPRLIYCTPSRQFPLGVTMSLARRFELLDFARKHGVWIVEDDYDSEFRYCNRPLPCLQGLTNNQCVIYAGSFSKVLFPSLRLGYLVLPDSLVDLFSKAKELQDAGSSLIDQATAAVFIEKGFFSTHVRRMRQLYRERLHIFLEEAKRHTAPWLTFPEIDAGMDATAYLKPGTDETMISKQLGSAGIDVPPISAYSLNTCRPGIVFGFTAFPPAQIRSGMKTVGNVLKASARAG
jgi:GntR family transcriptional regulator / MocR family aminotransferase